MCVSGRYITNKYTGAHFFVKCGRCKACQQEKALAATNRIRKEFAKDKIALFVTLTYDRFSCPYLDYDALMRHDKELNIYREIKTYVNPRTGLNRRFYQNHVLDTIIIPEDNYFVGHVSWLQKRPKKVGVCYLKDFQDFIKRLRTNCNRSYIYHEGFSIFDCSEYGPTTKRPHFHFLLFIRPDDEAFYRSAILKAWPFAHRGRTEKYIELARDPASYVASYVNCRQHLSPFLAKYFAPKHTYSQYFGFGDENFSLDQVLRKVDKGTLTYPVLRNKCGVKEDVDLLLPVYVINRYFPKFKGYSRLTCDEVSDVLLSVGRNLPLYDYVRPHKLSRYEQKIDYRVFDWFDQFCGANEVFQDGNKDAFKSMRRKTESDVWRIHHRLKNAYNYYHEQTGKNMFDYAIDYERVWRCYKSNIYRAIQENVILLPHEKYDNLPDVVSGEVYSDEWTDYIFKNEPTIIPNEYVVNKCNTSKMANVFDLYDKNRKVTNMVMASQGHFV